MAETLPSAIEQELLGIKHLLWGNEIKLDIFKRWSQGIIYKLLFLKYDWCWLFVGFYFSSQEKSALEQTEGGPCAIIAPVEAFILKNLLLEYKDLCFRESVKNL